MNATTTRLALATLAAASLTACTNVPTPPAAQAVTLRFSAEVAGQAFACGQSYAAIGSTRATLTPGDFRLFVSEVHLIDSAGRAVPVALAQDGVWQFENIALLDFENGSGPCRNGTAPTNTTVRGTVPAGQYTGLRFTLGVPFARNHGDPTTAPSPLNLTAMFWNWQGGYKFIKFDSATSGGSASGFAVHLGSTQCAAPSRTEAPKAACTNPNRVLVELPRFDAAVHTVVADIGAVLAAANVEVNTPNTAPGCMSFPGDADCPPVMAALGLAYGGVAAPGAQRLFSVR